MIGKYRKDALMRVWTLIWLFTFGYVLSIITAILAVVWGLIDVVVQLILDRDGLRANSGPAMWLTRSYKYASGQTVYAATGKGNFEWIP